MPWMAPGAGFLPPSQGGSIFCSFCRSLGTQGHCLAAYASVGPLRRACDQRHCAAAQNALLGPSWLSRCPALPPRKGWTGRVFPESLQDTVSLLVSGRRSQGQSEPEAAVSRQGLEWKPPKIWNPPQILPPWSGWFPIPVLKDRWSAPLQRVSSHSLTPPWLEGTDASFA